MTKRKPDKEVVCLGSAVGDEDDADDKDNDDVSLVMMPLVLIVIMLLLLLVMMIMVMLRRLLTDGAQLIQLMKIWLTRLSLDCCLFDAMSGFLSKC